MATKTRAAEGAEDAQGDDMQFIDIGANMTDPMFQGKYHGKQYHESDFDAVLARGRAAGVRALMVTGGSLDDSRAALALARKHEDMWCTVGCHPTRCGEFEGEGTTPRAYLDALHALVVEGGGNVAAIGECGLDYDRLHFCDKETQLKYFEMQFELAEKTQLPMFLHSRNAGEDMARLLRANRTRFTEGVVHSFDGSEAEMRELVELGLYIGINGCSLKTAENCAVAAQIPADRLMIETDCPWCEIKASHAGYAHAKSAWEVKKPKKWIEGACVKGRAEPCHIRRVLEVLAGLRGDDAAQLAAQVFANTQHVFRIPRAATGEKE